jgi:hypothetical protein
MKRLSRINGYRDSQIKRFNEMYEVLREDVTEDNGENSNGLLLYSRKELDEFRAYVVLAEADERKRCQVMRNRRSPRDFTAKEIAKFDHMQDVLEEFNRLVDDPDIDLLEIMPLYSDIEMAEHSQYREILQSHEVKKWQAKT